MINMHARIRQLRAQTCDQSFSARAASSGSAMGTPRQLAGTPVSGVSYKLPSSTLDGQTGMTIDVRLQDSSTRSSSRVSLPFISATVETNSSATHIPVQRPALSPLAIPSAYSSQPSPSSSTERQSFPDDDSFRTPSPIVFSHAPVLCPRHHQLGAAEPCDNCWYSSDYEHRTAPPPHAIGSEESPAPPASPSRVPISFEVGGRTPKFHLPTRSPPIGLRPSLELSPEYARARLKEDRAIFAGCSEDLSATPCPSYRHPISALLIGRSPDVVGSLPSITYMDRPLEGLPEIDEADKGGIVKSEGDVADELKMVSPVPPLKPVRQFYRKWFLVLRHL